MSVKTIEGAVLRLGQIQNTNGTDALTFAQNGDVILSNPNPTSANSVASTQYVNTAIGQSVGIGMDPASAYTWTGAYQIFNSNPIISIGSNLQPSIPLINSDLCLANQTGLQFIQNQMGKNEVDFLAYTGVKNSGFSFSCISSTSPYKQIASLYNSATNNVTMNLIGTSADYQINGQSIITPNVATQPGNNNFTGLNSFAGITNFTNAANFLNQTTTGVATFESPIVLNYYGSPSILGSMGQIALTVDGNIVFNSQVAGKGIQVGSGSAYFDLYADGTGANFGQSSISTGGLITGGGFTTTAGVNCGNLTVIGTSAVPTQPVGTNSTQIASCAFVLANAGGGGGNVTTGNPNTFTATNTFVADPVSHPLNMVFSANGQVGNATFSYTTSGFILNVGTSNFVISNGTANALLSCPSAGVLNLNGTAIINQTALTSSLTNYYTKIASNALFAPLASPIFTGTVTSSNIITTDLSIGGFPAVNTQSLANYAILTGAAFTGDVSSTGQMSCAKMVVNGTIQATSGTINSSPIVTTTILQNQLANFVSKAGNNTLTGNNAFITGTLDLGAAPTCDTQVANTDNRTVATTAYVATAIQNITALSPYVTGQIIALVSVGNAPSGFLKCDGHTYLVGDYPNLFGTIGNNYGGDGVVNFSVPIMSQGQCPIGGNDPYTNAAGKTVPAYTYNVGDAQYYQTPYAGSPSLTNLPGHTHTITDPGHLHGYANGTTNVANGTGGGSVPNISGSGSGNYSTLTSTTGINGTNFNSGYASVGIMNPFVCVVWWIYAL